MLTRILEAARRSEAERVWLALERRTGPVAVACSWAWTETWLAHYGDVVPHRFVVGVADGQDRGAALVTGSAGRYPPWVGARQAHIGTAGEPRGEGVYVERNRLLVAEGDRNAFASALLAELGRDPRWDRLVIPRWNAGGEPGKFASARFAGFHRALIDRLGPGRGVVLVRVRSDGETVGCVYGQIEDREVLFYQSGLRRYADNKLNAGLAVHVCAMRACVEHGMRAYDFLAPPARYKQDLSTRTDTLVWATLERDRPRAHLDRALRALRSRRARRASGG